jgi:hypothetical protein
MIRPALQKLGQVLLLLSMGAAPAARLSAQDLTPRSYVITPTGSNALVLSYAFNSGSILLDPTIPIKDLNAQFQVPIVSLYRSFSFFSRSANVAHFQGEVLGNDTRISRSGLADTRVRVSVNLYGGPAMRLREFVKYRERTIVGASLTMIVPTGQFDPARLINPGANRWGFKPEIGFARRFGHWSLDAYGGVWLFTTNTQFYPGTSIRKQNPIASLELHAGYYFRPRLWASFDTNFWSGGSTVQNGVSNQDAARNSRMGGTVAVPLTTHQSFKLTASRGAIVRVGGNFTTVTAAWQYSWLGKPK